MVSRDRLVQEDRQVSRGRPAQAALLGNQVLLDQLGLQGQGVHLAKLANRDHLGHPVNLVQEDRQGSQEQQAPLEMQGHQDPLVQGEISALRAILGHKVRLGHQVHRAVRVQEVIRGLRVLKDQLASLVLPDLLDPQEMQERLDQQVVMAHQVRFISYTLVIIRDQTLSYFTILAKSNALMKFYWTDGKNKELYWASGDRIEFLLVAINPICKVLIENRY